MCLYWPFSIVIILYLNKVWSSGVIYICCQSTGNSLLRMIIFLAGRVIKDKHIQLVNQTVNTIISDCCEHITVNVVCAFSLLISNAKHPLDPVLHGIVLVSTGQLFSS